MRALGVLRGARRGGDGLPLAVVGLQPADARPPGQHGFAYSSNLMDDIRPYRHDGMRLVELPVQWVLDDAPHFWFDGTASWTKAIAAPSAVREIWEAELAGIRELGGSFVLTMHPQIIGRPGRLLMLERFLRHLIQQEGIWIATARTVAERVP